MQLEEGLCTSGRVGYSWLTACYDTLYLCSFIVLNYFQQSSEHVLFAWLRDETDSPWPAHGRSNHFQTWMKRSTKSLTGWDQVMACLSRIQSVCWKCLTLKLKHPLLSLFLLTRIGATISHVMSSRESQGTPITSFRIHLDVEQRPLSRQVNQCIQDTGAGFINAANTLKGPERRCIHCIYLIVLYFTLICWMPRAWQNRKVIAWWAKRQQLHHNVQTPWVIKWDPQWHCRGQRKLHLPLPPLNGSEASENLFRNGWKGR